VTYTPSIPPSPAYPAVEFPFEGREPIHVAVAAAAPQSRLTIFFRPVLGIPHLLVLYVLGLVGEVIAVLGWFAALFTGRLPDFAAGYLCGLLRWQGRVLGYQSLLTSQYPPFSSEDEDYPVRVAMRPGRLNRLAVLFRGVLMIPALVVYLFASYGAVVISIAAWFIALATGKVPDSVHQALSAVLRYQLRLLGFAFMLTSEYPGGLYGDRPGETAEAANTPVPGVYLTRATASWTVPGPPPWRLVLSRAARNMVTVAIVAGLPALTVGTLIAAWFVHAQH
jgi:hypothetical protein